MCQVKASEAESNESEHSHSSTSPSIATLIPEVSCVTHGSSSSVCITRCGRGTRVASVGRLYGSRLQKKCHLPKPLNQREFVEPGTHLAPLGDTNARMTQPRLRTLNEIDLR